MNSKLRINGGRRGAGHHWRGILQRRQRRSHDPMLVLNMSIFNFSDGWERIFNPFKVHEHGTR